MLRSPWLKSTGLRKHRPTLPSPKTVCLAIPSPQPPARKQDQRWVCKKWWQSYMGKTWFYASRCLLPVSHKQTGRAKGSTDFGAHVQTAMASSPPLQMSSYIGFLTKAFTTRITLCPQPGSQALLGLGHYHLFGRDRFHSIFQIFPVKYTSYLACLYHFLRENGEVVT